MIRLYIIFVFIVIACSGFSQQIEPSKIFDIYFKQDFENNTLGTYNHSEWEEDWNHPSFEVGLDNINILQSTDPEQNSKVIQFVFPQGSTFGDGGGQWYAPLEGTYNELYFSFRVKFKPGFQPVLSGKLPGVIGSPDFPCCGPPGYNDGFRAKLAWNNAPDILNYVYHHDLDHDYGDPWAIGSGIPFGQWFTLTIRIVMNTIGENGGNNDGIMETFVNNKLQYQISNLKFRNLPEIGVDILEIVSFFGGDGEQFAAIRDEWIEFDDFFAFAYKPGVDVPRGIVPSAPDRVLILPFDALNDSIWRKSLTAHAISSKTVGLEWINYFYPVSYTIQRRMQSDTIFQDIAVVSFPNNSFKNSGLSSNTTYYYRIKAENSISDSVKVTTPAPSPPLAPTSLLSLQTDKKFVKIGWNDNSNNEIEFIIERSDAGTNNFKQIASVSSNIREFTNQSLLPNTEYSYRVKASNEDGQSAYTNVLAVKTLQLQLPVAPTNLNAGSITSRSCELTWKDNANNETGFQIFKLDENDGVYKSYLTVTANLVKSVISDLQANSSYNFKLRAYNTDGVSAFTNEIRVTTLPLQPPVAPITLKYDSIAPSSVYLRWIDRSDNEKGYQVYRSQTETSGYQLIFTTPANQTTYINNNLEPGKTFFFRVRAYNDDGVSAYTNIIKTVIPNPPLSPSNLVLKSKTASTITIGWSDNSNNETGFQLERSENNPLAFKIIDTIDADLIEYKNSKLKSNTIYYYRLTSFNQDGHSAFSDTIKVQTNSLILPASPSSPGIVSLMPFKAVFTWHDNSLNETGFQIQRADKNKIFTNLKNVSTNTVQYIDSTLQSNSIYFYRIRAYNNDGYSAFSDTLTILTPKNIIPSTPVDFKNDFVKYNEVLLSWTIDTSDISGYEIDRLTNGEDNYDIITKIGISSNYLDTTVKQGVTYLYRIRSFNTFNVSPFSISISVSIPFLELPEPPELLSPVDIESNTIAIKWADNSSDENGFIIKRALYPQTEFENLSTAGADDTLFVDKTVKPNTTYYYIVNAVNEKGQSENSNKLRVSSLSMAEAARFKKGLIAYYNFTLNSNNTIHDLSGFSNPTNLQIIDTLNINWELSNRLEVVNNTIIKSQQPAKKIVEACKESNEITLECWIKPSASYISNEASIISLMRDPDNVGISLMQNYNGLTNNNINRKYLLGLSTKSTETNGRPFLTIDENESVTLHHIVYTHDFLGEEKIYLNGNLAGTGIKPLGFDSWDDNFYLYLANEPSMDKPWTGMYYMIAIYNTALTKDQILQNYNAGPTDNIKKPDNKFDIKIYPNPSAGLVNFELKPLDYHEYGEKLILQLIDLNGFNILEEIISDSNQNYQKEFDLSHLQKGIYYFRIISSSGSVTQKILVL